MTRDRAGFELLHRVRERIVTDVVEERGEPDDGQTGALLVVEDAEDAASFQRSNRPARQVMNAERVEKPGMNRPGVREVGEAELFDATKTLELGRIDDCGGRRVEPDVLPHGIPDGPLPFVRVRWLTSSRGIELSHAGHAAAVSPPCPP
jgi:hypothetical protein